MPEYVELGRDDLKWALRRTPTAALKTLKEYAGNLFVGGGFLRACVAGEKAGDVDMFAPSELAAKDAAYFLANALREEKADGVRVFKTKNAYTVKGAALPIQVIHRWVYATPEELMASFDFTIAMAGFWWDPGEPGSPPLTAAQMVATTEWSRSRLHVPARAAQWRSICDPRFYADLAAKRLRYTAPARNEDAGGSLLRVLKFYQRGYRIPLDSMAAVTARLVQGVREYGQSEQDFAKVLTGLLREVDPNIDPSHIAHLPAEDAVGDEETVTDVTKEAEGGAKDGEE